MNGSLIPFRISSCDVNEGNTPVGVAGTMALGSMQNHTHPRNSYLKIMSCDTTHNNYEVAGEPAAGCCCDDLEDRQN